MRVIALRTLREFWHKSSYQDAEQPLKAWYSEAKIAKWTRPQDIKDKYRSASFVGKNRVIFNIAGNKYRLVVFVKYESQTVYIRFIGSHKEYDKIDVEEV
jgi:mRNA interferase HigB